ncbi:MAG: hypothetical protein IJ908_09495 [Fibrobacter sp.]|nr:hypothetical protein [Fibrobacter sp.]MBR7056809.1 hypothetical protein [Oscillospiraceae bacterium]
MKQMTGLELLLAMSSIRDDWIAEAIPKRIMEFAATKKKTVLHKRLLLLAAVLAALIALAAAVYAAVRLSISPIENTSLYSVSVDAGQSCETNDSVMRTPEQAALLLAELYLDDLCTPSETRSFQITAYRNLSVEVTPTSSMEMETREIYALRDQEIAENTWIVEIHVEYQYEGTMTPMGPGQGQWIDVLYQSSPIGFLMTRSQSHYTMQSRYY